MTDRPLARGRDDPDRHAIGRSPIYTEPVASLEASPLEQPLEWDTPLFLMARAQFEQSLPYAGVSDMVAERLSYP